MVQVALAVSKLTLLDAIVGNLYCKMMEPRYTLWTEKNARRNLVSVLYTISRLSTKKAWTIISTFALQN